MGPSELIQERREKNRWEMDGYLGTEKDKQDAALKSHNITEIEPVRRMLWVD